MINKLIFGVVIFVLTGFILSTGVRAQDTNITDLLEDLDVSEQQAFDLVFQDPDNPSLNIALAKIQLRQGNYKAAIGSLERILISDPSDLNANILLMQINMITGNHIDARRYALRLRSLDNATDEHIAAANQIIAKIEAENQRLVLSGFYSLGGGFDDNPEGGSKGNRALIGNSNGVSTKKVQAEEFMMSSLLLDMTYRLNNQSQSQVNMRLIQNWRDYSHYNNGDLSSTSAIFGIIHDLQSFRLGASLNSSHIAINESPYLNIYGGEINITHRLASKLSGTLTTALSRHVYKGHQVNATLPTGHNYMVRYRIAKTNNIARLGGYVSTAYSDATAPWQRHVTHRIGGDLSTDIMPGITTLAASYSQRHHDHLNPAFGNTLRRDIRRDFTLTHHIGLRHFSTPQPGETRLTSRANIRNESSTIANYHRNSGEVSITITRYF